MTESPRDDRARKMVRALLDEKKNPQANQILLDAAIANMVAKFPTTRREVRGA